MNFVQLSSEHALEGSLVFFGPGMGRGANLENGGQFVSQCSTKQAGTIYFKLSLQPVIVEVIWFPFAIQVFLPSK